MYVRAVKSLSHRTPMARLRVKTRNGRSPPPPPPSLRWADEGAGKWAAPARAALYSVGLRARLRGAPANPGALDNSAADATAREIDRPPAIGYPIIPWRSGPMYSEDAVGPKGAPSPARADRPLAPPPRN